MPAPAGLQSAIESGFEKQYPAIDIKVTSGTTGELEAKTEAERDNPVCDALILASWSNGITFKEGEDVYSYQPANAETSVTQFQDPDNEIFATSDMETMVKRVYISLPRAPFLSLRKRSFGTFRTRSVG